MASYGSIVVNIAKLALQRPNVKILSTLEKESPILENQRKSFDSISKDIFLGCFAEELPTALGIVLNNLHPRSSGRLVATYLLTYDQVVPHSSAVLDGFNVKQGQIQENHMDMCKFGTSEDNGYKKVCYMIKQVLKERRSKLLEVTTPRRTQLLPQPPPQSSSGPYYSPYRPLVDMEIIEVEEV